ncbi:alpha/beta hydrolase [Neisseria perflava]|uniref:alpha/beta hydrolase n=1 Tax=Neisseria perflava TaxID=33053 RepID=UPI0020A0431B|nr:alpha/beta hydrolase-fold protein [Neisseria perflava]MCP1661281.1 putative alpha/beta superfamily hydrolase [Neisseria perflava]MCP1773222.1 putative alpha/beta superfamily hydrolase [Neisseria perflava]
MIHYHDMPFPAVGKTRKLHIYLPDDYLATGERYPVMYFFDGHNLFFDNQATYGKSWGLYDFMQAWPKKMMIVGIECGHEGNERLSEYSPYSFHSAFFGGRLNGLGHETMEWIVNDIKPYIDSTYRTYPFREATGIAGSSMGGLMSIYAVGKYNRIFSKAACLSSAILNELYADMEQCAIDSNTRVYLSWGEQEAGRGGKSVDAWHTPAARANQAIAGIFTRAGAACDVYCQPQGRHTEADWEKQIPQFMDFLWLR